MRIAICDDDKIFLESIKELVFKTMFNIDSDLTVETYLNGNDLYKVYDKYDIIILDINMPEKNGFELAKEIRRENQDIMIIFLTSIFKYIFDSFELSPCRYVMKKYIKDKLGDTLISIYEDINLQQDNTYAFSYKSEYYNIPVNKILFFEYKDRKIELSTYDRKYFFYKTLNEVELQLKKHNFIRIHSAFLVNLDAVAKLTNNMVVLKNNQELPISKKRYAEVRRMYLNYLKKGL